MPQDIPSGDANRVSREPSDMGALELLRGALLLTPPGRMLEASQLLSALTDMASQQLVIESADMLGIGLTDPMDVHVASVHAFARQNFVSGTILSPLDNIPTSGVGREAALAAIARTERNDPGSFNRMLRGDPEATGTYQDAVDQAVANPEAFTATPDVQAEPTEGNVSVRGVCRPIRICFWPGARYRNNSKLRREYERQLALQERAINSMSPGDIVANRDAYCNPATGPGLRSAKEASTAAVRTAYRRAVQRRMTAQANLLSGRARIAALASVPTRVTRHMRQNAILHNPDSIAGGNPIVSITPRDAANVSAGLPSAIAGHRGVNSSIGTLWGRCSQGTSRSARLRDHAEQQAANGCPSAQADLAICRN